MRASGAVPIALAFAAVVTTSAAAPSLMPEAFPAVTEPSFLKAGPQRRLPRHVHAGTRLQHAAHHHVLDIRRLHARACHRLANDDGAEIDRGEIFEDAAKAPIGVRQALRMTASVSCGMSCRTY